MPAAEAYCQAVFSFSPRSRSDSRRMMRTHRKRMTHVKWTRVDMRRHASTPLSNVRLLDNLIIMPVEPDVNFNAIMHFLLLREKNYRSSNSTRNYR